LSKGVLTVERIYLTEVRVVEDVESLSTKLQLESFKDWKFPAYGQVHLPGTESADKVSWRVAWDGGSAGGHATATRRQAECIRIDRPSTGASLTWSEILQ